MVNIHQLGFTGLKPMYVRMDKTGFVPPEDWGVSNLPNAFVGFVTRLESKEFIDDTGESVKKFNLWVRGRDSFTPVVLNSGLSTIVSRLILRSLQGIESFDNLIAIELQQLTTNRTHRTVASCTVSEMFPSGPKMVMIKDLPPVDDEDAAIAAINALNKRTGYISPQHKEAIESRTQPQPRPQSQSPEPPQALSPSPYPLMSPEFAELVYIAAEMNGVSRQTLNDHYQCSSLSSIDAGTGEAILTQYESKAREGAIKELCEKYIKEGQMAAFSARLRERYGVTLMKELKIQDLLEVLRIYRGKRH
jgi:hypothetical protein